MTEDELQQTLTCLENQTRRLVFTRLCRSEIPMTPTLMAASLGLKVGTVSHHLVWLEDMGLCIRLKSGTNNLYGVDREKIKALVKWLNTL